VTNSRQKGARIEREAAEALRDVLGISARRSVQYAGVAGDADLISGLPSVHFEIKARKSIGALRFMEQAQADAAKAKTVPMVLLRENGDTEFYALMRLSDLPEVARKVVSVQAMNEIDKVDSEVGK
jgi:Holliday junction resolvase